MNWARLFILVSLAALAAWFLISPAETPADFSYVMFAEPRSLDPAVSTELEGGRILRALFEGLVQLDPRTLAPVPGMAERWEISPDGLTYTFHLRQALWSDNTQVVADDFRYAWERLLNPSSTAEYDYMLFYLKNAKAYRKGELKDFSAVGAVAPDDTTLVVTLENPTPFFMDVAAFESLLPVNRACVEKYGKSWTQPGHIVVNGAYQLTGHRVNHKFRLEKNPRYWNPRRVRLPVVDAFTCEGLNTGFNLYETGGADLIGDFPSLLADTLTRRSDALVAPYLGTYFFRFNVKVKPFDDNRVRRAFDRALRKDDVVAYVTQGGEVAAHSLVPPGIPGYTPPTEAQYDTAAARALLAEAGFPGGRGFPPVELLYNTSENHKKIAEAVAEMLRDVLHVQVTPVNLEWKVLQEKMASMDYVMVRTGWIGDYTDPNTFLDMFVTDGGNNRTHWSDERYDSLIALAAREADPAKRMAHFAQAETILLDEGPILPLYYYVTKFLVKPGIHGIYPNIRGYFHFADLYRQ